MFVYATPFVKEEEGRRKPNVMDGTDADMMEAETSMPAPESDVVRELLTLARQLIDHEKPSQALQAVVMAMRARGGDEAVLHTLNRARELYINKLHASAAADQLASLFAECAIAEAALPLTAETSQQNSGTFSSNPGPSDHEKVGPLIGQDVRGTSILAESGRKQIVLDAFSDGSSFVCLQCGGLVSNHRKEEHYKYWCCQI